MKKKAIYLLGSMFVALSLGFIFQSVNSKGFEAKTVFASNSESNGSDAYDSEKVEVISEYTFQHTIHKMTHQKVHAEDKWGRETITDDLIADMLFHLESTEYVNQEFYFETLTQWSEGNFDNAVDVHNFIWQLQGGTVGIATRLLSEDEEKKYLRKWFK